MKELIYGVDLVNGLSAETSVDTPLSVDLPIIPMPAAIAGIVTITSESLSSAASKSDKESYLWVRLSLHAVRQLTPHGG